MRPTVKTAASRASVVFMARRRTFALYEPQSPLSAAKITYATRFTFSRGFSMGISMSPARFVRSRKSSRSLSEYGRIARRRPCTFFSLAAETISMAFVIFLRFWTERILRRTTRGLTILAMATVPRRAG